MYTRRYPDTYPNDQVQPAPRPVVGSATQTLTPVGPSVPSGPSAPNGNTVQDATTQPVAQTAPETDADTSTAAGIYQLTPTMITQLQAAVNAAFSGLKGGETNAQITQKIVNYLSATGAWSEQMLALVQSQSLAIGGGSGSFKQQSNTGDSSFVSAWTNGIEKALNNAALTNSAPGTATSTSGDDGTIDPATEDLLDGLIGALGGNGASGDTSGTDPDADETESPYYVAPISGAGSSGGSSPILGILLLAIAFGLGIYWYVKHHHKAGAHHETVEA